MERWLSIHWFHIRTDCSLSVFPFVLFSLCMFDCVHVCTPSLGVKHKLISSPTLIAPSLQKTQECDQKLMTFFLLFRANSRFIIGQVSNRFCWERKVLSPTRVADGHVVLLWLYSASSRSERQLGNCHSLASAHRSSQTKHVADTEADCCRD